MISFQKQFLFVHVPRTGGNSIQSILRNYSEDEVTSLRPDQDGIERFGVRNPKYQVKKHSSLAAYRTALGDAKFRGLYKFSCVRNPWDRLVSLYFTPRRRAEEWDRAAFEKLVLATPSVDDFLRLDEAERDPFSNLDQILRFETLTEDFQSLCAKLKIPVTELPKYNRSTRQPYRSYYDDELRALVRRRFAPEIERFSYTF